MAKGLTIAWIGLASVASGALFLVVNPQFSPLNKTKDKAKGGQAGTIEPVGQLTAFKTDAAWAQFEAKLRASQSQSVGNVVDAAADAATDATAEMPAPSSPAQPQMLPPPPPMVERKTVVVDGASPANATNPEITNNQNVGVDEGGIVKQIGPYLLALQDGRIFSVDTRGATGKMTLADRHNVYADANEGAWYDEMLVQGDRVLVTAYSYQAQATAISVFRVDMNTGKLSPDGIFYVSSGDYYSGENYATRIVGDKLVLHVTSQLSKSWSGENAPMISVGARIANSARPRGVPLINVENLYRPLVEVDNPVVQSIVTCPLGRTQTKDLQCRSQSFLGPAASELLVTTTDAFLWNGRGASDYDVSYDFYSLPPDTVEARCANSPEASLETTQGAIVFRVPINGDKPSFAPVRGQPSNQFAMEVQNDSFFMLSRWSNWACEYSGYGGKSSLRLTTIPLDRFDVDPRQIETSAYVALPGNIPAPVVRFMDGWMVYHGEEQDIMRPTGQLTRVDTDTGSKVFATPLARPSRTISAQIPHRLSRLQPLAGGMLAVGATTPSDVSMSWLNPATGFKAASTLTLKGRIESEGRSHAFSATQLGDGRSLMGLPTTLYNDGQIQDYSRTTSSNLSFFTMTPAGSISLAGDIPMSREEPYSAYKCEVSCVDWYGNSRAIFTGGRIFALMGTEIVEGRFNGTQIGVASRLDMTGPIGGT